MATGVPGTYVSLNRKWSDRDKITFLIPMKFSTVRYTGLDQVDGNYDRYALLYGPLLMSVQGLTADASNIPKIEASSDDLPGILEAVPGSPLRFNLKGYPELSYVPYWQVQGKFTCFPIIQK